jgi:predicted dinucleotide-binding enzyme
MTTVGLIGSGRIGGTVAKLAVAAGHPVILSNSRGPDTLTGLAESWRQQPGTHVYGAPYGPFSDEKGSPASADAIREALAAAGR